MTRKRKVLTCLESCGRGGIETTLLRCLKEWDPAEIEMHVSVHTMKGDWMEEYRKRTYALYRMPGKFFFTYQLIWAYFFLRRHRFDVVHCRNAFFCAPVVLACRLNHIPVLVSIHSTRSLNETRKLFHRIRLIRIALNKWIVRHFATCIIGHSQENLNCYFPQWRSSKRASVIYNGIQLNSALPGDEERKMARQDLGFSSELRYLLNVGTFRPPKNHKMLIELLAQLQPQMPELRLVLVGGGSLRSAIEQYAKERGVFELVIFTGVQENTAPYYKACDLFVFPSLYEGLGNVVIEAENFGCPVACSDLPALREALCPVQHKNMFPVNDRERASGIIRRLLKSPPPQSELEESFQYIRQHFDIKKMAAALLEKYRQVSK